MIVDTLACPLLVLGVAFGLSRPVVDRMGLESRRGSRRRGGALADRRMGHRVGGLHSRCNAFGILARRGGGACRPGRRPARRPHARGGCAGPRPRGRPAHGDRMVRGVAFVRAQPLRRRVAGGLARALAEGPLLPARMAARTPVLRHLPAAGPPSPFECSDGRVHAHDGRRLRALPAHHDGAVQPGVPSHGPPRGPVRRQARGARRRRRRDAQPALHPERDLPLDEAAGRLLHPHAGFISSFACGTRTRSRARRPLPARSASAEPS